MCALTQSLTNYYYYNLIINLNNKIKEKIMMSEYNITQYYLGNN